MLQQRLRIHFPEQQRELLQFAHIILDASSLITLTGGRQNELLLGDLNLYGDGAVQAKIRTRVAHPDQFEDVFLELTVGSIHKANGHKVTPLEVDGLPDLRVDVPGDQIPLYAECKCLRSVSSNRLNKVIVKANSQIKASEVACYGVVYLDISHAVRIGIVKDAERPPIVEEVIKRVAAALKGPKNRYVGAAILIWDFYIVHGTPPEGTLIAFLKNYVRVSHSGPEVLKAIPPDCQLFSTNIVLYTVEWEKREDGGTVSFTL